MTNPLLAAGLVSPLQVVSGPIAVVVALVTQLGDLWFMFTAVALVYWLDEIAPWVGRGLHRERAATVVALLVGAVAILETLKPLFGVARPPGFDVAPAAEFLPAALESVYVWMATAEGYSFPSGHAVGSIIVWGGLAWGVHVGKLRTRAAVAAAVVGSILASRVLLGVHYPVDVVGGAVIGLTYLVVVLGLLRDPGRAFVLATAIAVAGVAVGGLTTDSAAALGLAVGLTATWFWLDEELVAAPATRAGTLATTALGLLVAAPVLVASITLDLPLVAVAVAGAVGGGLLLALPLVGERVGVASLAGDGRSDPGR